MPGLFSRLFRRKTGEADGLSSAASRGSKKSRRSKRKDSKHQDKKSAVNVAVSTDDKGVVSVPLKSFEEAKGTFSDADLPRQNSYTGTNTSSNGRDQTSNHSGSVGRESTDPALSPRALAMPKHQYHQTQVRVLSPRNQLPNLIDSVSSDSLPNKNRSPKSWGGPVDLDESDFDNASDTGDENVMMTSHTKVRSSPGGAQRLSVQHLQHFDKLQQQKRESTSAAQFYMPSEEPRFSAGHVPVDDTRSDASSSSFNLSTDAEDTEYEALKRRGVVPAPLNTSHNNQLDSSTLSGVSSPTNYNTDGDNSIFPALQTDDEGTATERESNHGGILSIHKVSTDDEGPDPLKLQTDEDARAWTVSPTRSSLSPKDRTFPFGDTAKSNHSNDHAILPLMPHPSGGTSPSSRRNFTSPKSARSPNSFTSATNHSNALNSSGDVGFADFADFSNVTFPADTEAWGAAPKSPTRHNRSSSTSGHPEVSNPDSALQAKRKHSSGPTIGHRHSHSHGSRHHQRLSASSVNSAPAITAKYLRQHHNLKPRDAPRSPAGADGITPVSDIIDSLEIANASRSSHHLHHETTSTGSRDGAASARAAKERLRERRRREREYGSASTSRRHSRTAEQESSDGSDQEASESWLFDEVTGALGPRGIAADLESLSGRSNRSKSSSGNKSHRSHRSHRSSHRSSRRRKSHSHSKQSSGESVDSRGSRHSRNSRSSRYSHRSTRSYLSQMSEQSRSVANDLLRLEMQLAMVGSQEPREDGTPRVGSSASVGGASRASRKSRTSSSNRRTVAVARRNKVTIMAPPGKLGIILANKADSKGTVVSGVRSSSVLSDKISPGDRIVAIDGEDVSLMTVSEITTIMARKSDFERTLTVLTTPKHLSSMPGAAPGSESKLASPKRSSDYHGSYGRH